MKRVMLYFGSFNPIHKGHISLAEYVVERDLADQVILMISPQSPYKTQQQLAPEVSRYEMAEMACKGSKYPERIVPSVVEFLLPKPSYTIDTLRYLESNFGSQMQFSILMGGDQIERLDGWKEYERILEYPLYVYPRRGEKVDKFADRIRLLEDAPLLDFSSTEVRATIERGDDTARMLHPDVAKYIREKGLWSPAQRMATLNALLDDDKENIALLLERGQLHYRMNEWGAALNDFNAILRIDPQHAEARQLIDMVQDILTFRYTDLYNP